MWFLKFCGVDIFSPFGELRSCEIGWAFGGLSIPLCVDFFVDWNRLAYPRKLQESKNRLVECVHSHLSDDKAVAKMGHPFVRGERGRTDNSYGKEQAQRQRESDCNGEWVLELR